MVNKKSSYTEEVRFIQYKRDLSELWELSIKFCGHKNCSSKIRIGTHDNISSGSVLPIGSVFNTKNDVVLVRKGLISSDCS